MIKIELSAPELTLVLVNTTIVLSVMVYLISRKNNKAEKIEDDRNTNTGTDNL